MTLFDSNIETIGDRAKGYAEPVFEYYNRSTRKDVVRVKQVLEDWFARSRRASICVSGFGLALGGNTRERSSNCICTSC